MNWRNLAAALMSQPRGQQYLLFLRGARLFAQPFDVAWRLLSGDPVPIAEPVANRHVKAAGGGGGFLVAAFSVSPNGVLAYRTEFKESDQLTMMDRKGTVVDRIGELGTHRQLALSPDEKMLAVQRIEGSEPADLYLYEMTGGRRRTRLTFNPLVDAWPRWSPDGSQIAFASQRVEGKLDLYVKRAFSAGDRL